MVISVWTVLLSLWVYLFGVCFPGQNGWIVARTQLLLLPDYYLERCNQFAGPSPSFKCAISPSTELGYHCILSFIFIFAMSNGRSWTVRIIGYESREEDLWVEAKKQNWAEAVTNAPSRTKWMRVICYSPLSLDMWWAGLDWKFRVRVHPSLTNVWWSPKSVSSFAFPSLF